MKDLVGVLGILMLLPFLILGVRLGGRRFGWSGEHKRKMVHIGMGLTTLSFPWIFSSWIWVAVLCGGCLVVLRIVRRQEKRVGGPSVLHDVDRQSWGEICFPAAVVIVFALADGQPWRHVIPILVLTLADAAGALVGVSYGRQKFRVFSGSKTTEGSLLVFFVAFLSVHVPLLLMTETGRAETLLVALTVAMLAMLIEAVSVRGLDNIVLPVLVAALLPVYTGLSQPDLLLRVGVATGLFVVVLSGRRDSSLQGGALLAAVLLGYAVFFFGGWRFLLIAMILYGEHIWVSHRIKRLRDMESNDLWVIFGLALSFAPWLALAKLLPDFGTLALRGFVTAVAIHLACFNYATRLYISKRPGTPLTRQRSFGKALVWVLAPGFLLSGVDSSGWLMAGGAVVLVQAGLQLFRIVLGNPVQFGNDWRRWGIQSAVALGCSLPLWVIDHWLTR